MTLTPQDGSLGDYLVGTVGMWTVTVLVYWTGRMWTLLYILSSGGGVNLLILIMLVLLCCIIALLIGIWTLVVAGRSLSRSSIILLWILNCVIES